MLCLARSWVRTCSAGRPSPRFPCSSASSIAAFVSRYFFIHAAIFEVKAELDRVLDKSIGTSNVVSLDLGGDSLLKFRAESDVHWPQVVLQNLSILV